MVVSFHFIQLLVIQILSVISEDWLIMRHAYLQNCVYCVYCIYTEVDRGTLMKIILKNNSDFPIYEQIKQQVKQKYFKGTCCSWRAFAVNERTCQRSSSKFRLLPNVLMKISEKDGFVTTIRGKGTFVKEQDSSILKEKQFLPLKIWLKNWLMKRKPSKCHLRNCRIF